MDHSAPLRAVEVLAWLRLYPDVHTSGEAVWTVSFSADSARGGWAPEQSRSF